MPSLFSRNKSLVKAAYKCVKADIKVFWFCFLFSDFLILFQIFCQRLNVISDC